MKKYLSFALTLLLSLPQFCISQTGITDVWSANDKVLTTATFGDITYIGGNFTYLGKRSGHGALLNPITGKANLAFPYIADTVFAIIPDGNGYLVATGNESAWATPSGGVLRVKADLTIDENFQVFTNGPVRTLTKHNGDIYFGGGFNRVNNTLRPAIASVDEKGSLLSWNPNIHQDPNEGAVYIASLFSSPHTGLLICGAFDSFEGKPRKGFVHLDNQNKITNLMLTVPNQYDVTAAVTDNNDSVYISARTRVDGSIFGGVVAKLDLNTNATLWERTVSSPATKLIPFRAALYTNAGQSSTGESGATTNTYATAFHTQNGNKLDWNPNTDGQITSMWLSSNTVYLAGNFTRVKGIDRLYSAAVSAFDAALLPWDPGLSSYGRWISEVNGYIAVGGYFNSVNGKKRNHFAAINTRTNEILDFDPSPNGSVTLILIDGATVYVFGGFSRWNREGRGGGVAFNAITTTTLINFRPPRTLGTIWCGVIAEYQGKTNIYLGGDFSPPYSFTDPTTGQRYERRNLAAVNAETGALLNEWRPEADNIVREMTINGTELTVKGDFGYINNIQRIREAKIDLDGNLKN